MRVTATILTAALLSGGAGCSSAPSSVADTAVASPTPRPTPADPSQAAIAAHFQQQAEAEQRALEERRKAAAAK